MLNKIYRITYERIFNELLEKFPQGYFDEAALPSYTHRNALMSWLFWKRIDVALKMAGDVRERSVLDFGCGGGVLFQFLADQQCRITGCDRDAIELTREVIKRLNIKAEIHDNLFAIANRTFDVIFALDVLEHIEELDRYLEKLFELSHERTVLIVSGPTEGVLYRMGRWLAGFSGHYHIRNIYDIESKLKGIKLKNRSMKNLYHPIPLFRISSWQKYVWRQG